MFSPVIVLAAVLGSPGASEPPAGLAVERLYHGVGRPVPVTVTAPGSRGTVTLVVMDAAGLVQARPVAVRPGRLDLAEVLPGLWQIRRASYLQLLDEDRPVGPSLVLQPMLSRMVPITEVGRRPNGTAYTRVAGWKDESELEAPSFPPKEPASVEPEGGDDAAAPPPDPGADRVFSGLRIYVERDVLLHTSKGDILLAMRPDEAPNTVWNFLDLAGGGFYDDVVFHRVVPFTLDGRPFVIQAGDPTATGEAGPGYWLPIEPSLLPHEFGVISMARADPPDSAGSQFFICLSREGTARLDGQYCAFGYAVEGADTIAAIAAVELADPRGRPVDPPVIDGAELVPAPGRTPGKGRPDQRVSPQPAPEETKPPRVPR